MQQGNIFIGASLPARFSMLMNLLVSKRKELLLSFCNQKVLESGLVPRNYSFAYNFVTPAESRKSITSLSKYMFKTLGKQIPYTTFTTQPMVTASSSGVQINMGWSEEIRDARTLFAMSTDRTLKISGKSNGLYEFIRFVESNGVSYIMARTQNDKTFIRGITREEKRAVPGYSLGRYCAKMNLLMRKKGIPLRFRTAHQIWYDNLVYNELKQMEVARETGSMKFLELEKLLNLRIETSITVLPAYWSPGGVSRADAKMIEDKRPEDSEAIHQLICKHNLWETNTLSDNLSSGPLKQRADKMFFYLEDGMKILRTLTRKATYGPAAFEFRTAEG